MLKKLELECSCGEKIEDSPENDVPIFQCPQKVTGARRDWWHILKARRQPVGDTARTLEEIAFQRRSGGNNPYKIFAPYLAPFQLDPDSYRSEVDRINKALQENVGVGFRETPVKKARELSERLGFSRNGGVWLKDETGNVTGSHKARHAMGTMLYLQTLAGEGRGAAQKPPELAIYSCGNAALGAAAVARAADHPISVFVPEGVDPGVLKALVDYRARVHLCVSSEFLRTLEAEETPGAAPVWPVIPVIRESRRNLGERVFDFHENPAERHGDPTYLQFQEAIKRGALPISCSGPDNWSAIDGGKTLAFEMATQLLEKNIRLDSIVIQVGGGALASSAIQAYEDLERMGIARMPKIHVTQTVGGFPLVRAYYLLLQEIAKKNGLECSLSDSSGYDDDESLAALCDYCRSGKHAAEIAALIEWAAHHFDSAQVQEVLRDMVKNPSRFMRPWHKEPKSSAHGILDDVTYDGLDILRGLLKTGGRATVVTEEELETANGLIRSTAGIDADHTGTSGLAGLLVLREKDIVKPYEKVGIFVTGRQRENRV